MSGRVQGKIAIVTGASNGIGREISLLLAKEGATVLCSDLNPASRKEGTAATHEEIKNNGGTSSFQKADTTNEDEVAALVAEAVKQYGRLDIMVNNAGIAVEDGGSGVPVWDIPAGNFDKTLNVNAKGVFLGCKYASKAMKDQEPGETGDRGWIVNTASIMGHIGIPNALSYVTSKHACVGITKVAALDCAPHRIHVNAVCPGFIATDLIKSTLADEMMTARVNAMHPFGGVGKATDIAKAVLFLCSPDNTYMTGSSMIVDGGYTAL